MISIASAIGTSAAAALAAGEPVPIVTPVDRAWEYGVLGIIALVFGYAIITLYKRGEAKVEAAAADRIVMNRTMDTERAAWALERQAWALERERVRAELGEKFARDLREVIQQFRENEATIRRESADMLEGMAAESKRASDSLVAMLQKFHDRALSRSER